MAPRSDLALLRRGDRLLPRSQAVNQAFEQHRGPICCMFCQDFRVNQSQRLREVAECRCLREVGNGRGDFVSEEADRVLLIPGLNMPVAPDTRAQKIERREAVRCEQARPIVDPALVDVVLATLAGGRGTEDDCVGPRGHELDDLRSAIGGRVLKKLECRDEVEAFGRQLYVKRGGGRLRSRTR